MLGYDQLCALGTQLNVYYEAYDLLGSPSHASVSVSAATLGTDGGDDATSDVPPSRAIPYMCGRKKHFALIQPLSGSVCLTLNCVNACTVANLPVVDQRML
jgi:hypothetical protein